MRVRYVCHYSALTGYGRAARDYAAALTGAGHEVQIVDWRSFPGHPDAAGPGLFPLLLSPERRYTPLDDLLRPWPQPGDPAPDVVLAHGLPSLLAQASVFEAINDGTQNADPPIVAMTTWETDRIPDDIARGLSDYEHLIVPSSYSAKPFEEAFAIEGPKVHVVPHGFDPAFWPAEHYGKPRLSATTRFYTHGAWTERKNHLSVLKAYLHAFTDNDPVGLMLCSQGVDEHQVQSMILRSGLGRGIPSVSMHGGPISEESLLDLHQSSDVFVTATRGEAWGLPIFEAAILGKTIIAPAQGGHADFLRVDQLAINPTDPDRGWQYNGWRAVSSVRVPYFAGLGAFVRDADGHIIGQSSALTAGMDCRQTWLEPSIWDLAMWMRHVHAQRQDGLLLVHPHNRTVLERRFGYPAVAAKLASTLQEIIWS